MNILFYSHMGRGKGGGESVFKKVANGLEKKGQKVDRLYYNTELKAGCYELSEDGYNLFLYMPPKLKLFLHPKFLYRAIASLIGLTIILYRVRPAVVNYHYFMASSFYFALLKKVFGYRLIISCHGSDVNDIEEMKRLLAPYVLKRADLVTGVSKALIKKMKTKIPGNYETQVIHNGVDYNFWSRNISKQETINKELSIVSVGALKSVKGHDVLLNAFEKVINSYPKCVSLNIIGNGPKKDSYESFIKERNLDEYIHLKGWLAPVEVREELHKASLFVFPSRHEGFGLALIEAMVAGLPIVASNTGGIPEILEDTGAVLVPPESPNDLAEAIITVLNHSKEISRKKIQIRAQEFSWEQTINQYEQILVLDSYK